MALRPIQKIVDSLQTIEGGGFPVKRPFPMKGIPFVDPFMLFDHMGPVHWGPGKAIGAPDHPHRGFETVTYLLEGRMEHRDSVGHKGELNPGDVQWMTAGAGVVHSEMPHPDFQKTGGVMNGFQIWVNLPKKDKMMEPRYQEVPKDKIPTAWDKEKKVEVKVIAGKSLGQKAVIATRTPIIYLHFTIYPGGKITQEVHSDFNTLIYVIKGEGSINDGADHKIGEAQMVLFKGEGDEIQIKVPPKASAPLEFLLLAGKPLKEPVARYGPFVMNTEQEILQAVEDFRQGRLGKMTIS